MSNINFETKGIGKLIKERQLSVPIYQRPYAWEDKHINDLFSDIHEAISSNENEYFLGTIVLSEKDSSSELELVDGQQRITSIFIFLTAAKEYFESIKESETAQSIQRDFLTNFDRRSGEHLPRIKLGNQDNSFFRDFIIDRKKTSPTKESHQRIINTKSLSLERVKKLAELSNNKLNVLHDWLDFIENKLRVVVITVPSKSNAFTIFETLNDRGLVLAQVDLLKNYLYSKAGDRLNEVQNLWIEMSSQIETAENESLIITYIKHYWSARYSLTREKNKELYNDIKSKIKNTSQVVDFINGLKNDSILYLAILNHNHQYWNIYNKKTREYLETLNFFKLEQFRPLLLAILKKFKNKKDVEKSLKLLVSWLVRNLITGSLGGGTLEKEYANKARNVFDEKIKNAKQLKTSLQHIIPSDKEFKEKFIFAKSSTEKYSRYYLRAIENQKSGGANPELLVNSDPEAVNLEHILPRNPHDNWPNFSEEEVNSLKNRIGNFTLMKSAINSKQGNDNFTNKCKRLKKSKFWITKMISQNYNNWNAENIRDRQEKLSNLAVEVWNLKLS